MPHSHARTIEQYAAAIASGTPTPGGGSVVATTGAFAAALAEMVANLTLAGKTPPTDPAALQRVSSEGQRLRATMLELALADEAAYGRYREASAMPRSTPEEQRRRRQAIDEALIESADVPIRIARAGIELMELFRIAAEDGTRHALSDVSTGAMLAGSAIRGALITARANAELMRDPVHKNAYLAEISALTEAESTGVAHVLTAVERRSVVSVSTAG